MRRLYFRVLRTRFIALSAIVLLAVFFFLADEVWLNGMVEKKIEEFSGGRFEVDVRSVHGGLFDDMVLEDVSFTVAGSHDGQVFRLDRVEIPYRIPQAFMERFAPASWSRKKPIERVGVFFSGDNPFIRGFVQIYSYPGRMELLGSISPELFGDSTKRGLKGSFLRQDDGTYTGSVTWDGSLEFSGLFNPESKDLKLDIAPCAAGHASGPASAGPEAGSIKVQGSFSPDKGASVYARVYRWDLFGAEMIGDLEMSYKDEGQPVFRFHAGNLLVNKRPVWDVDLSGRFDPEGKRITIEGLKWGEGMVLKGGIKTQAPFQSRLDFLMNEVEMSGITEMFGPSKYVFQGPVSAEVELSGPIYGAKIKGRLFFGEGIMGEMAYQSIFATLGGTLPVIEISDARVTKYGGNIIINGYIDMSKFGENRAFDNVQFLSDNKVAVWDYWQITKEDGSDTVMAEKDNLMLRTSMKQAKNEPMKLNEDEHMDVGLDYKIDGSNRIKVDIDEEDDFVGLEHKIHF